MKIYFAAHGTTVDNENNIASGWQDCELSDLGKKQAAELGTHFTRLKIDAVYCSDLKRSADTGRIAFGTSLPLYIDTRLREINYGEHNGGPKEIVDRLKPQCIDRPFPGGESYQQAIERVEACINELIEKNENHTILIIGHRATQFGIEVLINNRDLAELVAEKFVWQPHWEYTIT